MNIVWYHISCKVSFFFPTSISYSSKSLVKNGFQVIIVTHNANDIVLLNNSANDREEPFSLTYVMSPTETVGNELSYILPKWEETMPSTIADMDITDKFTPSTDIDNTTGETPQITLILLVLFITNGSSCSHNGPCISV